MFHRIFIDFFKDKTYRSLAIKTALILLNGTVIYHFVEKWNWVDSFYFSVITLTTVGYGDLAPQTDFGKIFTSIYVLVGIGMIFGFINAFHEHRSAQHKEYHYSKKKKATK